MKRRKPSTVALFVFALNMVLGAQTPATETVIDVRLDTNPSHVLNSFDPDAALGSSIDVLSRRDIDLVFTPHIIEESLSAGYGPITYRNNTELRMAAWHWNPNGSWSDKQHESGYFTGSAELGDPIRYILAYALPHRGFSTSGDRPVSGPNLSYWKSNPYLTSRFTGESDSLHPQWVVVDLKREFPVNAVQVAWADPYATRYRIEYWKGNDALDFDAGPQGEWIPFPAGVIENGGGATGRAKVGAAPVNTRFVRVWMIASSNTCDEHGSNDIRNCVGYAIRSIGVGRIDDSGNLRAAETDPAYVSSSIDPWHSAADVKNDGSYQHTGFDLFFTSGITNSLPAMIPVTMLYGTPDDAAAQIEYLKKRGYSIGSVEMGEEPDGKHALPEDYGALYLQWASAIHRVDPKLKLGGPIFEGVTQDIRVWPDAHGRTSWMGRFVSYLKEHGRLADLSFVSFEHYPFDACHMDWNSLYDEPRVMKGILQIWRADGVPPTVPLMVTESSIAPALAGPMSTVFAALWLADSIGSFFEAGGAAYYHSPIQPQTVDPSCSGQASWSNFEADRDYRIRGYTAFYYAAQMINKEWALHRSGMHRMFRSTTASKEITSYALLRPDRLWSILLVNHDKETAHSVHVPLTGPVRYVTFGAEQYRWQTDHAEPDHPPEGKTIEADGRTAFMLPPASITVLRGRAIR